LFMVKFTDAGSDLNVTMPAPEIIGLLCDVPGGETNLLPVALTHTDLKVWFTVPANSDPTKDTEKVELFVDDGSTPVASREFDQLITDSDRYVELPQQWLRNNDGEHQLRYRVTIYNCAKEWSSDLVMTLDTLAPALAADSTLIFPEQVLPPESLTADYLAGPANNDQVLATVPDYRNAAPGDVVTATWTNPADGTSAEIRTEPLTHLNYLDPIILPFTGDFIRDRGDGDREVTYRIEDRALNPSAESAPAKLRVAAIRPPRFAPHPWVVEIVDDPSDWGELDPEKALTGATVRIPEEAVYFADDRVEVQFGEPGATGSITVPVVGDSRDVAIPKENIAAYLSKTLQVTYVIYLPDGSDEPSSPMTLVVRAFSPTKLLGAQLAPPHSDPAYKSNIPPAGLPVFQRIWPYISTRCLITITVTGTGTDSEAKTETILDAKPVTEAQIKDGVSASVTQGFMLNLKNDTRFRVQTKVSFDNGDTWFPFTLLSPMLKP
jgi:hypothetical protein